MQFTQEPEGELLKYISKQMAEKQNNKVSNKIDRIIEERKDLKDFRKRIIIDTKQAVNDKLLQKIDFMSANDNIMTEKIQKVLKYNDEKVNEKMNYFPFTHGDAIEA